MNHVYKMLQVSLVVTVFVSSSMTFGMQRVGRKVAQPMAAAVMQHASRLCAQQPKDFADTASQTDAGVKHAPRMHPDDMKELKAFVGIQRIDYLCVFIYSMFIVSCYYVATAGVEPDQTIKKIDTLSHGIRSLETEQRFANNATAKNLEELNQKIAGLQAQIKNPSKQK